MRDIKIVRAFVCLSIVAILLVPVVSYLLFSYSTTQQPVNPDSLTLNNGDLILRRGRSIESYAVYLADRNRDYSHIGIVVFEHEKPFVVHAVPGESGHSPEKVIKESLLSFLSPEKASHFAVYRSFFTPEELKKVAGKALGFFYQEIEFDNDYDLNSDHKLYCTELVLKAYRQLHLDTRQFKPDEINFLFGRKRILFPGIFIRSPDFFKVYAN